MIPKTIHYIWVGPPKPKATLECIESWKRHNPDFSIIEWNEHNFPVEQFPFAHKMYTEKKWSFFSDYARLHVLYEHGGFYLDTDMLLVAPLTSLVNNSCVLGEENSGIISAGMIGAVAHHPFIELCKKFYDNAPQTLITIPRVLSEVFKNYPDKSSITVLPPKTFYPFDSNNIGKFHGQDLGPDVLGVHLWHYSWGSPLNKFFKKIGIYAFGKKVTEALGIKRALKKLFGFI
jgi:mannosyltransferase OCH1-like enzyme